VYMIEEVVSDFAYRCASEPRATIECTRFGLKKEKTGIRLARKGRTCYIAFWK
jgi:hypothetical protein